MRRHFPGSFLLALVLLFGCSTVPYTDRTRFMVLDERQDISLGLSAFQQVLEEERVLTDPQATRQLQRVKKN